MRSHSFLLESCQITGIPRAARAFAASTSCRRRVAHATAQSKAPPKIPSPPTTAVASSSVITPPGVPNASWFILSIPMESGHRPATEYPLGLWPQRFCTGVGGSTSSFRRVPWHSHAVGVRAERQTPPEIFSGGVCYLESDQRIDMQFRRYDSYLSMRGWGARSCTASTTACGSSTPRYPR